MNIKSLLKLPFKPVVNRLKRYIAYLVDEGLRGSQNVKFGESPYDSYIRYLYYEISQLRSLVRYLVADKPDLIGGREQTMGSFEHQWRELPHGQWMFSNPEFRTELPDIVCSHTDLDRSWFPGKKVLDAGCGSGRYTYALCKLGANVTAFDQSASGLATAKEAVESEVLGANANFIQGNLLEPLPLEPDFDLVWSFGVLHHTGDTYRGFHNVASLVKPGGYLFLMLYGEPRLGCPDEFAYRAEYSRLRALALNCPPEEVVEIIKRERPGEDVHGWFDAISPTINDCYQFEEIKGWLLEAGFEDIKQTHEMANLHLVSRRKKRV